MYFSFKSRQVKYRCPYTAAIFEEKKNRRNRYIFFCVRVSKGLRNAKKGERDQLPLFIFFKIQKRFFFSPLNSSSQSRFSYSLVSSVFCVFCVCVCVCWVGGSSSSSWLDCPLLGMTQTGQSLFLFGSVSVCVSCETRDSWEDAHFFFFFCGLTVELCKLFLGHWNQLTRPCGAVSNLSKYRKIRKKWIYGGFELK